MLPYILQQVFLQVIFFFSTDAGLITLSEGQLTKNGWPTQEIMTRHTKKLFKIRLTNVSVKRRKDNIQVRDKVLPKNNTRSKKLESKFHPTPLQVTEVGNYGLHLENPTNGKTFHRHKNDVKLFVHQEESRIPKILSQIQEDWNLQCNLGHQQGNP